MAISNLNDISNAIGELAAKRREENDQSTKKLPYFVEIEPSSGRYIFHLDSHMAGLFAECERKFYLTHVLGYRAKGRNTAMSIGSWWSAVLEDFYKDMALGIHSSHSILINALERWTSMQMPLLEHFHPKQYYSFAQPMSVNDLRRELPSSTYPVIDMLAEGNPDFKLPAGAIRMAARYYEAYAEHDSKEWKIIATEAGFGLRNEVLLYEDSKIVVYWVGKPDLVIFSRSDEQLMPLDHKTTDYIKGNSQSKYKPHPQTAGYIYAVGLLAKKLGIDRTVDRCIINLCARSEPSETPRDGKKKPRFVRIFPSYSVDELDEFRFQIGQKVLRLREALESGIWVWKESSCHIYAGCDFRRVDSVKESSRQTILDADFTISEPWIPYSVEEDE